MSTNLARPIAPESFAVCPDCPPFAFCEPCETMASAAAESYAALAILRATASEWMIGPDAANIYG